MKKTLCLCLALLMLFPLLMLSVSAADTPTEGTYGENISWSFDANTGTLTVTGEGAMKDLALNTNMPWNSLRKNIKIASISEGITHICNRAFENCSSLTDVTIPSTLRSVGENAFDLGSSLQNIHIKDLSSYASIDYANAKASPACYLPIKALYMDGTKITAPVLPDGTKTIANYAFNGLDITAITIPSTVTEIGVNAFVGCLNLKSVQIPDSVTTLGSQVFGNCTSLESVTLSQNLTVIPTSMFNGCNKLFSITLPNNLQRIESSAFVSCSSLKLSSLPESVTYIGSSAFQASGITNMTLPQGITELFYSTFANCSKLTRIVLPKNIEKINASVFASCSALTSIIYCGTEAQWNSVSKHSDWRIYSNKAALRYHDVSSYAVTDNKTHSGICSICSEPFSASHRLTESTVAKNPTHTEAGILRYKCNACAYTTDDPIPKLTEHSYSDWVNLDETRHQKVCACGKTQTSSHKWDPGKVTKEPTSEYEGEKTFTCTDCKTLRVASIAKLVSSEETTIIQGTSTEATTKTTATTNATQEASGCKAAIGSALFLLLPCVAMSAIKQKKKK